MKTPLLLSLLAAFTATPVLADDHSHHMAHAAAADATALTDGTIKKVDKAAGKVTVAHGPLANLGMPAMTMAFRVKDAAWLDQMKAGDKVRILVEQVGGAYTVTRYEPVR